MRSFFVLLFFAGRVLFAQQFPQIDSVKSKIAPSLKAEKSVLNVRVLVKDKQAFRVWFKENFPGIKLKDHSNNFFEVPIGKSEDIIKLEKSSSVIFIDRAHRAPTEESALSGIDFTLNSVSALHKLYPIRIGEDTIVLSVKEKPFDVNDIDLKGRIVLNGQFDEAPSTHATIMATIAVGAGNSEPSSLGVSPQAHVTTSDFSQLLPDDGNALTALGVSVQNHSYGVGVENYYGIEASEYDKHCQDFPKLMHVFSSGNDGDKADIEGTYSGITGFANLTGQFKTAKNSISVGSTDAFGNVGTRSSRGPTQDGRVKPEVVAFGDAGSSESAAIVSGIALRIQQRYYNSNFSGVLPPSSLVKAILINSADDVGRPHVDFETGFGSVDALGALRTIDLVHYFLGYLTSNDLLQGFGLEVPAGTRQLKITLVWNDQEALPNETQTLRNDLDLELIYTPTNETWKPWVLNHYPHRDSLQKVAVRMEDHINNVEQITVINPPAGLYMVEVNVANIQPPGTTQEFSLVYEFESGFEWINPVDGNTFASGSNTILRWKWNEAPATGVLECKFTNQSNWTVINNNVVLSQEYFVLTMPDTSALMQFRLNGIESDIFPISKPINLKVGYNCDDEAMLLWDKVPNAEFYYVYRLGEAYLQSLHFMTDTFAILNDSEKDFLYFAAMPVFQDYVEGIKGATENYTLQGTGCYVISFLPRQYIVTDAAVFDATIGTTYSLDSITLERMDGNEFQSLQTIKPVTSTNLVFADPAPQPGTNLYRVRVDRSNGELAYSETEEVVFMRKQDIFIYPNPVVQGELSSVVIADQQTVSIKVYDFMGRLLQENSDSGAIKTVNTSSLIRGNYVVEIIRSNGVKLRTRLIVW